MVVSILPHETNALPRLFCL